MRPRVHVPFDNWAMPIDVSVSQMVRVGDLAWSCGQCPLDEKGQVRAPGDLRTQTRIVCDYIETLLPRADLTNASVAQLVCYYVETHSDDAESMTAIFRDRFGATPLIVPVAVPHFYYPGLMLEVDFYASAVARRLKAKSGREMEQSVDGGIMSWASIQFPSDIFYEEHYFAFTGAEPFAATWIADRSFDANNSWKRMMEIGLCPHENAMLMSADRNTAPTCLITTVADATVERSQGAASSNGTDINVSRTDDFCWVSGTCPDNDLDLVGQTRAIMGGLAKALANTDLTFDNVVKLNAHYVGSPSPEDLHENMKVRHSYYGNPGPASTGLPVAGLGDPAAKIAIDILAIA